MLEAEYVWPFSVPYLLPEPDKIPYTQDYTRKDRLYRHYTGAKYGRARQMLCGIHINYSLKDEFLKTLFETQTEFNNIKDMKDAIYTKLAQNYRRYMWLIVYLFGASPYASKDYVEQRGFKDFDLNRPMRSLRKSPYGYIETKDIKVRLDSVEHYLNDLTSYIEAGKLKTAREYYGEVRLKAKLGEDTHKYLREKGVAYIEFRNVDLNPYCGYGLSLGQLEFFNLFLLYLLSIEKDKSNLGDKIAQETALEEPFEKSKFYDEGMYLLEGLLKFSEKLNLDKRAEQVKRAYTALENPELSLSAKIVKAAPTIEQYQELAHNLGQEQKEKALNKDIKNQKLYKIIRDGKGLF